VNSCLNDVPQAPMFVVLRVKTGGESLCSGLSDQWNHHSLPESCAEWSGMFDKISDDKTLFRSITENLTTLNSVIHFYKSVTW